ncbi:amino acid ABC transporter permease [Alkaliphilus peptidifermentans]|uniref:Amino acid ABC transporter membrane protein, PAAT family (TC 3.A.1.3.-) n=1 Tax=Alkaliphilus peptidifermentans DSM 18978 TaxID=1120976 RepID=A0A1G5F649_9FIRM|nr:amino acid ABC transporter permease [Alkaliphilus peptidifermentans]SCY34370.1 amino acid ABC transporter membrane protein, PAAT family (TC 3.A.1.3.-) [Alkaliphilus peptidifermentans DSM 18978]
MNFNIDYGFMLQILPRILKTLHITLGLATMAMILGLIIATILALIGVFKIKVLHPLSKVYISFFRGTPLLAQLFLLYFGIPRVLPIFAGMNAYTAALIGLSLHSAAYMSETIRGAVISIDKGQMEACLSVGMSKLQGMRRVVLPQAFRIVVPPLVNSFISLIKESSLAFTLGVAEMLAQAKMSAASTYQFFESYLVVLLVYWAIAIVVGILQDKLEAKLNQAY